MKTRGKKRWRGGEVVGDESKNQVTCFSQESRWSMHERVSHLNESPLSKEPGDINLRSGECG